MRSLPRFIIVAAVFIATGCDGHTASSRAENGFLFFDPSLQRAFVSALAKEGVPFRRQNDGTVVYDVEDDARVSRIRASILESSYTPSYHFVDQDLETRFLRELEAKGIRYGVEIKQGKRWITWAESDNAGVEKIRDRVLKTR